jgi:hypothetical protein
VTAEFRDVANNLLQQRSEAGLPLVVVGHPVGGITREEAEALITEDVVEEVVRALTKGEAA